MDEEEEEEGGEEGEEERLLLPLPTHAGACCLWLFRGRCPSSSSPCRPAAFSSHAGLWGGWVGG